MFLLQEVLRVRNTRQTEAVKRLNWIHGLMQPNPGFVSAVVARYLGNPTDYLILRAWADKDAYLAFRQTPDGSELPEGPPRGPVRGPAGRPRVAARDRFEGQRRG